MTPLDRSLRALALTLTVAMAFTPSAAADPVADCAASPVSTGGDPARGCVTVTGDGDGDAVLLAVSWTGNANSTVAAASYAGGANAPVAVTLMGPGGGPVGWLVNYVACEIHPPVVPCFHQH